MMLQIRTTVVKAIDWRQRTQSGVGQNLDPHVTMPLAVYYFTILLRQKGLD